MRWFVLLGGLVTLCACASAPSPDAGPGSLVLRGVSVIDGTGSPPSPGMDVVIEGDRIAAIQPSGRVRYPRGATILDLPGRSVMPGLIDTHAHVTVLRWYPDPNGGRRGVYDRGVSERTLRVLLAHGITTVRNPSAPTAEGVALREAVARGEIMGPRILTSGEHLNDPRLSEAEIRAEVRRQVALGVDMIKVYAGLPPSLVRAAIEEAHAHGVKVVGHLQRTTWTEAARLGIDAITHGSPWSPAYLPESRRAGYRQTLLGRLDWLEWVDPDGPEIREMIGTLVEHRIPVDPTLIAYHTKFFGDDARYLQHPEHHLVPEIVEDWRGGTFTDGWTADDHTRARALWPTMEALVRRYHEAGVLLAAGSDLPNPWVIPGVGLHEELELLVGAGIPPLEVLTIATRNGAETLGLLDELGTIEVGKRADLLVLSADPVADIRNTRRIEQVIQNGVLLRLADLLNNEIAPTTRGGGPASGRWRPASEAVPWDSVERGIGVVAFREALASGEPRVDTLRIHEQPSPLSPLVAMVVFDERSPAAGYTLLAAPGVRRHAAEYDYEELGVPFDSLVGDWARVIYAQPAAGPPLRGWVHAKESGVRLLRWADLLQQYSLFLADPDAARFHDAPGGAVLDIRLTPPNQSWADYDLWPVRAEGAWMQVRVVMPSSCSGEPEPATERLAWIRYLDPAGRPLVWPRTRGC